MTGDGAAETVVDARGHRCPTPTLRLRRALEHAADGEHVVLIADDPMARIDVPHFVAAAGHELLEAGAAEGEALRFVVRRASSAAGADRGRPGG